MEYSVYNPGIAICTRMGCDSYEGDRRNGSLLAHRRHRSLRRWARESALQRFSLVKLPHVPEVHRLASSKPPHVLYMRFVFHVHRPHVSSVRFGKEVELTQLRKSSEVEVTLIDLIIAKLEEAIRWNFARVDLGDGDN